MFNKKLFAILITVITIFITLYGLLIIPIDIVEKTHSKILGLIFSITITITIAITIVYYFISTFILRKFGIKGYKTVPILAYSKTEVFIDKEFNATIKKDRLTIYPKKPVPEDLVDIIELSEHESIDEKVYSTEDAIATSFIRKTKNRVAVCWEPKQEIIANTIYNHIFEYKSPSKYGIEAFWHSCIIDCDTGQLDFTFHCKHDIEYAIAFTMPFFNPTIKYPTLDKLAFITNKRDCAQPKILEDNRTVTWHLINPKINHTYVCFTFYEGGVSLFRKSVKRSWIQKALLLLRV
jgi:hypothetical protein